MSEQKGKLPSIWDDNNLFALDPLRRQIDRLFSEFSKGLPAWAQGKHGDFDFWPSAELVENDKEATIRVELPGIEAKDVDISVADNEITIKGEKRSESESKEGEKVTTERSYGSFSRLFALGYPIDAAKVEAKFDKGVLTLKIAKPETVAKPVKKIEIN